MCIYIALETRVRNTGHRLMHHYCSDQTLISFRLTIPGLGLHFIIPLDSIRIRRRRVPRRRPRSSNISMHVRMRPMRSHPRLLVRILPRLTLRRLHGTIRPLLMTSLSRCDDIIRHAASALCVLLEFLVCRIWVQGDNVPGMHQAGKVA